MARKNIKVPEELFLALRDDKDEQQSWPHYLETECLQSDSGLSYDDIQAACESAIESKFSQRALEELINEWRERADREARPEQWALEKCADELEGLINDE